MHTIKSLFEKNESWAKKQAELDPDYFKKLSSGQKPEFLWIGCGDSRVPAEEILGLEAGELFVHRNVANQVLYTDINARSVIEYAVLHLKVKHVIVCGHYGCGGVHSALSNQDFGETLNMWLKSIKEVYSENKEELAKYPTEKEMEEKLVEYNVLKQIEHLKNTSTIQKAWKEDNGPTLHGWVFSLETGKIKSLIAEEPHSPIEKVYQFENLW